ncbi:hypothetical protein B0H19DRAFT_1237120 [Mycena capillaripes]|nr:hypothetical protein B0H19DRAFT_1237120 [Mycena capillaripes]
MSRRSTANGRTSLDRHGVLMSMRALERAHDDITVCGHRVKRGHATKIAATGYSRCGGEYLRVTVDWWWLRGKHAFIAKKYASVTITIRSSLAPTNNIVQRQKSEIRSPPERGRDPVIECDTYIHVEVWVPRAPGPELQSKWQTSLYVEMSHEYCGRGMRAKIEVESFMLSLSSPGGSGKVIDGQECAVRICIYEQAEVQGPHYRIVSLGETRDMAHMQRYNPRNKDGER